MLPGDGALLQALIKADQPGNHLRREAVAAEVGPVEAHDLAHALFGLGNQQFGVLARGHHRVGGAVGQKQRQRRHRSQALREGQGVEGGGGRHGQAIRLADFTLARQGAAPRATQADPGVNKSYAPDGIGRIGQGAAQREEPAHAQAQGVGPAVPAKAAGGFAVDLRDFSQRRRAAPGVYAAVAAEQHRKIGGQQRLRDFADLGTVAQSGGVLGAGVRHHHQRATAHLAIGGNLQQRRRPGVPQPRPAQRHVRARGRRRSDRGDQGLHRRCARRLSVRRQRTETHQQSEHAGQRTPEGGQGGRGKEVSHRGLVTGGGEHCPAVCRRAGQDR